MYRQADFVNEFNTRFGIDRLQNHTDPFVALHTKGNQYLKILYYYETCEVVNMENVDTDELHQFVSNWFETNNTNEALYQQVDAAVALLLSQKTHAS
jgi:hypothetical protein